MKQATTKRVLAEALFIEQATLGPQQISIGKGEGDSRDVDFALVLKRMRRSTTPKTTLTHAR